MSDRRRRVLLAVRQAGPDGAVVRDVLHLAKLPLNSKGNSDAQESLRWLLDHGFISRQEDQPDQTA